MQSDVGWQSQQYGGPEVQITMAKEKTQQQVKNHNSKRETTTVKEKRQIKNTTAKVFFDLSLSFLFCHPLPPPGSAGTLSF